MSTANNKLILVVLLAALFAWPALGGQMNLMQKILACQSALFDGVFQNQRNFQKAYDEINQVLMDVVDTDDVEENIKAVRRWIKHFTDDIKGDNSWQILQALFQLEALSDEDPDLCTRSSHDTLAANDRATRGFLNRLKAKETPKRRVDKIVHYYALRQAKECELHYLSEFKLHRPDVSQANYDRVTQIVGDLIVQRMGIVQVKPIHLNNAASIIDRAPFEASKVARKIRFRAKDQLRDGKMAYIWLKKFASQSNDPLALYLNKVRSPDDSRQRAFVDDDNLHLLVEKYLTSPCEEYVQKLQSAFADDLSIMQIMSRPLRSTTDINEDELAREYYKHASYWHGCDALLKQKNALFSNLRRRVYKLTTTVTLPSQ